MRPAGLTDAKIRSLLVEAYKAAAFSRDRSTQNGALLYRVERDQIVAASCNNFPEGVAEPKHRLERPLKYSYVEHAERSVIYKAACHGATTNGCIMVCPWFACCDCARAIICAGIRYVVGHKQMFDKTPESWKSNIDTALDMLSEANVSMELHDGVLNTSTALRFNEEIWVP